jgi:hypothetical protein
MRPNDPPAIATWMLEHLTLGHKNEALAGDLLEEFKHGRSIAWYWRQALVAIVLGFASELRTQWPAVVYAALWSVPQPAYSFYVVRRIQDSSFVTREWQLAWPYSTLCDLAFTIVSDALYVWVGLALYFLAFSWAMKSLSLQRLTRGLWISVLVYVAVFAGLLAYTAVFPFHAHPIDVRQVTPVSLFTDPRFLSFRLRFFLTLLISIWAAGPRLEDRTVRTA